MINVKLSLRLQAVASFVPQNAVLFDVGTDHAYLPCALLQKNIIKKAYAGDKREGPLRIAAKSVMSYGLTERVTLILGDGIEKIAPDVDCIVIAGMGYDNVIAILDKKDLSPYHTIILQVNRKPEHLRAWIAKKGYAIQAEKLVKEEHHYYEIVVISANKQQQYSRQEIVLGPCLLQEKSPTLRQYWRLRQEEWQRIDAASKRKDHAWIIEYINSLLE